MAAEVIDLTSDTDEIPARKPRPYHIARPQRPSITARSPQIKKSNGHNYNIHDQRRGIPSNLGEDSDEESPSKLNALFGLDGASKQRIERLPLTSGAKPPQTAQSYNTLPTAPPRPSKPPHFHPSGPTFTQSPLTTGSDALSRRTNHGHLRDASRYQDKRPSSARSKNEQHSQASLHRTTVATEPVAPAFHSNTLRPDHMPRSRNSSLERKSPLEQKLVITHPPAAPSSAPESKEQRHSSVSDLRQGTKRSSSPPLLLRPTKVSRSSPPFTTQQNGVHKSKVSSVALKVSPNKSSQNAWTAYTDEENQLMKDLREQGMKWPDIGKCMPGRSLGALQVHFYTKVNKNPRYSRNAHPTTKGTSQARQQPRDLSQSTGSASSVQPLTSVVLPQTTRQNPVNHLKLEAPPSHMRDVVGLKRRAVGGSALMRSGRISHKTKARAASESDVSEPRILKKLSPETYLHQLCRHRELGAAPARMRFDASRELEIRNLAYQTLGTSRYIDDASGDVATVAWSPDDRFFAGGAVVLSDANSMQYNRPRNLLLGSPEGPVRELPDHHISRPQVKKGVNALHAMQETQDPRLFTTVQMVGFSPDSQRLHAVSIDGKLSSYKLNDRPEQCTLEGIYQHDDQVDLLTVSRRGGLIATGSRSLSDASIRILEPREDAAPRALLSLGSKEAGSGKPIYPSALKWGVAPNQSKYLLAGFAQEKEILYADDDTVDIEGETCLINGETGQRVEFGYKRNVFDVAWNPTGTGHTAFAVAGVGFGKLNHGMKSVVRMFGENQDGALRCYVELECPARDINDVVYCPCDDNLIAVGSTDGKVYVWDVRFTKQRQDPNITMTHGGCLSVLPHERNRWEADTGIRFLSWGANHSRLYSGSSDGIVKCWNPYVSNEDTHIKDIATYKSAIMSGAFNSDYTSLLIGEDAGRLNLLEIGKDDFEPPSKFDFLPAPEPLRAAEEPPHKVLLETGQIVYEHCGALPIRQAVQGPNYKPNKELVTASEAELHIQAQKFQRDLFHQRNRWKKLKKSMAGGPKIKPCQLECGYKPKVPDDDDDEVPDTKRSSQRIPDELRRPAPTGRDAITKGLLANCSECGAKCLPAEDAGAAPICEECGFACLRCGERAELYIKENRLHCAACQLDWDIGALGYEVEMKDATKMKSVSSSFKPASWEAEFGDEQRAFFLDQGL